MCIYEYPNYWHLLVDIKKKFLCDYPYHCLWQYLENNIRVGNTGAMIDLNDLNWSSLISIYDWFNTPYKLLCGVRVPILDRLCCVTPNIL